MTTHLSDDAGAAVDAVVGGRVAWYMRSAPGMQRRTQTELGRFLGLDQSAVSKKLRGERPFFLSELYAISGWLEVPINELLLPMEEMTKPPLIRLASVPTDGSAAGLRPGDTPDSPRRNTRGFAAALVAA